MLFSITKYITVLIILFSSYDTHSCTCAMQPDNTYEAVEKAFDMYSSVVLAEAVSVKDIEISRVEKLLRYNEDNPENKHESYYETVGYKGQKTTF